MPFRGVSSHINFWWTLNQTIPYIQFRDAKDCNVLLIYNIYIYIYFLFFEYTVKHPEDWHTLRILSPQTVLLWGPIHPCYTGSKPSIGGSLGILRVGTEKSHCIPLWCLTGDLHFVSQTISCWYANVNFQGMQVLGTSHGYGPKYYGSPACSMM